MGIHIGGNTESDSMGRTNEANVGEPGVTQSDTGFFRAFVRRQVSGFRLQEKSFAAFADS